MLPIPLVGDVQKAFHQVKVCQRDRDCFVSFGWQIRLMCSRNSVSQGLFLDQVLFVKWNISETL